MKLEDLYKKYPFVYQIDGEYYYLGNGVCKVCDSRFAISYYEEYKKILHQIGEDVVASESYNIDGDLLDSLIYNFRKVKAYSNVESTNEDQVSYRKKIADLIDSLTEDEKIKILNQLENFVRVFRYYYRKL